jgi:uncharacterized protein YbjT (DUF2867 family)
MPNTVLVTGGSGFIGTWVLRELLEAGRRLVAHGARIFQRGEQRDGRIGNESTDSFGAGYKKLRFILLPSFSCHIAHSPD